jgi:hypothetical protein
VLITGVARVQLRRGEAEGVTTGIVLVAWTMKHMDIGRGHKGAFLPLARDNRYFSLWTRRASAGVQSLQ